MVPVSWLARNLRKCSLFRWHQPFLGSSVFLAASIVGCAAPYRVMIQKSNETSMWNFKFALCCFISCYHLFKIFKSFLERKTSE